jgi:hypothetical protein
MLPHQKYEIFESLSKINSKITVHHLKFMITPKTRRKELKTHVYYFALHQIIIVYQLRWRVDQLQVRDFYILLECMKHPW